MSKNDEVPSVRRTGQSNENVTPPTDFPVVGIGASAGGLAALEALFGNFPADEAPGMAFVIVQHLSPDHKSLLSELIGKATSMQVFEVKDGMPIVPSCVYVIPPGMDMACINGALQLLEPVEPRGKRHPINYFFRSLALDQHENAIGIILSGTGTDGTQGLLDIHFNGGTIIVQEPASAEFDGMPLSALQNCPVDCVLPPEQMAAQIKECRIRPSDPDESDDAFLIPHSQNAISKIHLLLRTQTGHDFSRYKANSIHRRIKRRMDQMHTDSIDEYVVILQRSSDEVEALFHDLLIGVTQFFRDPESFEYLKTHAIPTILADRPADSPVRIWVCGCSTGEEAYSIAIIMHQAMEELGVKYPVQIFATDIDPHAIDTARTGNFPPNIATDIPEPLLARYFSAQPDGSGYRIQKTIRDMLIFSVQDVIKDPPFSKIDLISCRNLMIYMGPELQQKLIPTFHYALNPGGFLFLGSAESLGKYHTIFDVEDHKSKLFRKKESVNIREYNGVGYRYTPPTANYPSHMQRARPTTVQNSTSIKELTTQTLLRHANLSGAMVNEFGDILYLQGRTGAYLELPEGEISVNNILRLSREGLRRALTVALHKAVMKKEIVRHSDIHIHTDAQMRSVNITLIPVASPFSMMSDPSLYLVIFEETKLQKKPETASATDYTHTTDCDERVLALQRELHAQEEFLQSTNDQLELSNQELIAYNEEMQSMNEELQSANEELETSKEELQSVNEELSTVNAELQTKVTELSHSNNDMNNLLAGSNVGTVFLDHQLCIMRFTPSVTRMINLIQSDLGRPIGHIVSNLVGYETLVEDVHSVLETLIPRTLEVQTKDGSWFTLRIQPYRTVENVIEGAVITFVDISEMVQIREDLRKANEKLRLAIVINDAYDAITVQDTEGKILAWNPAAEKLYGWSEAEALAMNTLERIPPELKKEEISKLLKLANEKTIQPYLTRRLTKEGRTIDVQMTASALINDAGDIYAVSTTERLI